MAGEGEQLEGFMETPRVHCLTKFLTKLTKFLLGFDQPSHNGGGGGSQVSSKSRQVDSAFLGWNRLSHIVRLRIDYVTN